MGMISNGPGTLVLGAANGGGDRAAAVSAVKARLRVASSDEDALIAAFAETALGLAERFTGQATIARTMVQRLVGHGGWQRIGARLVRTIGGIGDADSQPLPGDSYAVDIDADAAGWVRVASGVRGAVTFEAGLADSWDTLPPGLREGSAMLAAHLFDDRTGQLPIPAAVTALWRPFRLVRLGMETRA